MACKQPDIHNMISGSGVSLASEGESASLALVCYPSSDGIKTKRPYGVDVLLHGLALLPIFSWLRLNLILFLDHLRLA